MANEERKTRVLFLCTGNACRSQMGEALLRHLGGDRFEAFSAGSRPAGFVHPLAIEALEQMGVPAGEPRSKSWDEFAGETVDVVITLCDDAVRDACPSWPGRPVQVHWGLPDPSFYSGSEEERLGFCIGVAERLRAKLQSMIELPFDSLSSEQLKSKLEQLAAI